MGSEGRRLALDRLVVGGKQARAVVGDFLAALTALAHEQHDRDLLTVY